MKWSTALFGHEKPRYYVQDSETGLNIHQFVEHPGEMPKGMKLHVCTGVAKRAETGDVVAFKPDKCWHCDAVQHSEIVSMIKNPGYLETVRKELKAAFIADSHNCTEADAAWRFERIWRERYSKFGIDNPMLLPSEIKSYFSFLPGASLWHLNGKNVWGESERRLFLIADVDGPETDQLPGLLEPQWDTSGQVDENGLPVDYVKKRRLNIPLDTLRDNGVNIDDMLDPNIRYVPEGLELRHTHCFDKLQKRLVKKTDKLRTIQPTNEGGV